MKTNRTIFTLLLLGFFSMLFSCDTDYLYNTEIRIENASQHDVEIIVEKPSSEFLTGSVALKSGTTFTTKHSIDGGYGLQNNFCSATAFEKKMQGKRSVEYIFEFTDEDYEYARKHADKTKI